MYPLSETQYRAEAESKLRQVFITDNPFGQPFSTSVAARKILYPFFSYLEEPFLVPLIKAAINVGDTGCYLTQLWRDENESSPNHCYIPLSELSRGYTAPPFSEELIEVKTGMKLLSEYVLYSERGKWGVMVSHEHHGLLGGSLEFMDIVSQEIPDIDEQVCKFLDDFRQLKVAGRHLTLDWLPEFLEHVYGREVAERMLIETKLP
ncbi:hypothetical protein IQ268_29185 [Oculatella sp. LEGE 06141]|uniref:hypothetical protein n=1 Tax=Oculatella sp. LEGE 06141 TaxID=1828648 RepID=UPI001880298F|nr:hypothetical protein [Oculatella sp. LEGE 06141]MBE9182618.1 hypothetical protein [Oculatella sp. LEGE 06141]